MKGLPSGSVVKNPPANAGDAGSIPGSERSPGEENYSPLQCEYVPGEFHGHRSPEGCSPWGHKVLDMT